MVFCFACGALGLGDGRCDATSPQTRTDEMRAAALAAGWHLCRTSRILAERGTYPDVAPHGAACPAHAPKGLCAHCIAVDEAEAHAS